MNRDGPSHTTQRLIQHLQHLTYTYMQNQNFLCDIDFGEIEIRSSVILFLVKTLLDHSM